MRNNQLRLVTVDGRPLTDKTEEISQSQRFYSNTKRSDKNQLELPLIHQEKIHSITIDSLPGSIFRDWLKYVSPRTIIDLRLISVFDQPGYSREQAMADFTGMRAEYIAIPVDLRGISPSSFDYLRGQAEWIYQNLEQYGVNIKPPIATLFSASSHLEVFSFYLNRISDRIMSLEWGLEQA